MSKQRLLQNWTDEHTRAMGNENLFVQHRLMESGLFSDESLIRIMDQPVSYTHLTLPTKA